MSRIFISYRRADSAMAAGRLYDHLSTHFGENLIFMDIDTIEPGEDFVEVIENAVGASSALVAVIGPDWLTSADESGQRRLDNPNDFVRLEIETALERSIRVIPVLVDGAVMPLAEQLPASLVKLTRRNALVVSNERFRYDIGKLIETLDKVVESQAAPEAKPPTPKAEEKPVEQAGKTATASGEQTRKAGLLEGVRIPFGETVIAWAIGGAVGGILYYSYSLSYMFFSTVAGAVGGATVTWILRRMTATVGWRQLLTAVVGGIAVGGLPLLVVSLFGLGFFNVVSLIYFIVGTALIGGGFTIWRFRQMQSRSN
jgi:hypothetical protein